ncbi:cupin domain-containing protein [Croceicoccus bisphenolivorans]|uniref:cupin domain-containing protein n=1 Tax=Croceicoccus bisphenolivorans TaxID=1783232 RepID=UPI000AF57AF4|nr:cupin domain-containing protein [Croceicoccus bisphenolivorans]
MQHVRPVDFSVYPEGQFHSHFMANWDNGIESCMALLTVAPPGTATGANGVIFGSHTHDVDQFYFILEGEMTVHLADETHKAGPGSLVFLPKGFPHWNQNDGDVREMHLELLAPSAMTYDFAAKHAAGDPIAPGTAKGTIARIDMAERASGQSLVRPLIGSATGSDNFAMNLVDLAADAPAGSLTVADGDRLLYVVDGELTVEIGLDRQVAGPHTLVVVPAGTVFRASNGGVVTRYVEMLAPEHQTVAEVAMAEGAAGPNA